MKLLTKVLGVLAAAALLCYLFYLLGSSAHEAPQSPLEADRVFVQKGRRVLTLMSKGNGIKLYRVSLGKNPTGPKTSEADGRTPEGVYIIDSRNAKSRYHLALHISYPNAADMQRARKLRVSPGGNIMLHGLPNRLSLIGGLHRYWDWTDGCIGVTDPEIEEIWRAVPNRTPIEIRP